MQLFCSCPLVFRKFLCLKFHHSIYVLLTKYFFKEQDGIRFEYLTYFHNNLLSLFVAQNYRHVSRNCNVFHFVLKTASYYISLWQLGNRMETPWTLIVTFPYLQVTLWHGGACILKECIVYATVFDIMMHHNYAHKLIKIYLCNNNIATEMWCCP